MKERKFTEPNKTQLYYRDLCLTDAQSHAGEYYEATISHESVWGFNGVLSFILSVKAKPNTGMLFISDKTWSVKIGRRGRILSTKLHEKREVERVNKYCIFI